MIRKMNFQISGESIKRFYFNITWGMDERLYIKDVDDYATIMIRASTEGEAIKIFKKFVQAIKCRSVRLVE